MPLTHLKFSQYSNDWHANQSNYRAMHNADVLKSLKKEICQTATKQQTYMLGRLIVVAAPCIALP